MSLDTLHKITGAITNNISQIDDDNESSESTITSLKEVAASNPREMIINFDDTSKRLSVLKNGSLYNLKPYCVAEYDFDVDGGAIGDISLRGSQLPANAVVTDVNVYWETAAAGATATVAYGVTGATTGIETATAITTAATAGLHKTDVDPTDATTFVDKDSSERSFTMSIGTAALTAGKAKLFYDIIIVS